MRKLLFCICIILLWVSGKSSAMTYDMQEKFIEKSEQLIGNMEKTQHQNRSTDSTNFRQQVLNPDYLEAEKFINNLSLSEQDKETLRFYNVHVNEKPIEGLPLIPRNEVLKQIREAEKNKPLFTLRAWLPPMNYYYNRYAAVDYAKKWTLWHNPQYPYFSQNRDCTNFLSQALRAGGLSFIFGRKDWATY